MKLHSARFYEHIFRLLVPGVRAQETGLGSVMCIQKMIDFDLPAVRASIKSLAEHSNCRRAKHIQCNSKTPVVPI